MLRIEDLKGKRIGIDIDNKVWKGYLLMEHLEKNGISWRDGDEIFEFTFWEEIENVGFSLFFDDSLTYHSVGDMIFGGFKMVSVDEFIKEEY